MSTEKKNDALSAILKQYEDNTTKKQVKKEKTFDLKNYFSTFFPKTEKKAKKVIRILPAADGESSPFVELHVHSVEINGEYKKFVCLKHTYDKPCPFCQAREQLYSKTDTDEATGKVFNKSESQIESDRAVAKKYNSRKMYVVKLIERGKEDEGIKFWRFNHDSRGSGVMDKIMILLEEEGYFIDPKEGKDITIHLGRDQKGNASITSITANKEMTPVSADDTQSKEWLADARTWEDVYGVKSYEYLEIIVKGGEPMWDKDASKFVDKADMEKKQLARIEEFTKGNNEISLGASIEESDDDDVPF
jgi:hypothetical protein